jgi:hypothetical protein
VTTFRVWVVNLNATLSSGLGKDEDEYVSVNDIERWSSKVAGDMELDLRRGVDLLREEEEDFFFCSPPKRYLRLGWLLGRVAGPDRWDLAR